jgi:hypothetical protein
MKQMNKKGQYGINVVVAVSMALFVLLLIGIAIIVGSNALITTSVFPATTGTTTGETGWLNKSGYTLTQASIIPGFSSPSIVTITNATSGVLLSSGNYTLTGNVLTNGSASSFATVTINYTYSKYSDPYNQVNGIVGNNSNALSGFFGNSSTFFSILTVVVIMIFLGLMIGAVYLFTRGKQERGL